MEVLGIVIEEDSVKGAIVDTKKGEILSGKKSIDKIEDTRPHKLISKMHKVVKKFDWDGPVGVALPAAVRKGRILTSYVLNEAWVDADADHLFSEITGCDVYALNASDAAGLAEVTFGVGKGISGTIVILTIGETIGSSVFVDETLVPNTELGHIEIKGITVEERASNRARKEEGIQKKTWAKRLQFVLEHYEKLFHPEMFIIGGQISSKANKTLPYIKLSTRFKPAEFKNDSAIVGAAYFAMHLEQKKSKRKAKNDD
ncbi:MAG: ROK family protein [Balneolaceae bacterium]|nr:ROK family protein [Balneolaceae bacterium]